MANRNVVTYRPKYGTGASADAARNVRVEELAAGPREQQNKKKRGWFDKAKRGGGGYGGVALPPLDPVAALQNSEGHRQLYTGYRDQIALLANQQQIANRRLQEDRLRNDQARFGELQAFAGASNERGVLGSSIDFTGRMGIRDEFLSNAQALRNAWSEGKLANIAQRMQARRDYESGILQLKMNKAAQQAMDKIYKEVQENDDTTGGPRRKPNRNPDRDRTPNKDTYRERLERLREIQAAGGSGARFLENHPIFAKKYEEKQRKRRKRRDDNDGRLGGPQA